MRSITFGRWRLRRRDDRNWALQEWREPGRAKCGTKATGPGWHDTGNFFQSVPAAVEFAYERDLRADDGADHTLPEAVAAMRLLADGLSRSVRDAVGHGGGVGGSTTPPRTRSSSHT